ncbi:Cyclic nucleotide-binding domain-containing protein 2 [Irineochytrium annulatum]|nr:Cyclic nucleotide-binding domain-containing protein 2 [Irineochytrium annulatum]
MATAVGEGSRTTSHYDFVSRRNTHFDFTGRRASNFDFMNRRGSNVDFLGRRLSTFQPPRPTTKLGYYIPEIIKPDAQPATSVTAAESRQRRRQSSTPAAPPPPDSKEAKRIKHKYLKDVGVAVTAPELARMVAGIINAPTRVPPPAIRERMVQRVALEARARHTGLHPPRLFPSAANPPVITSPAGIAAADDMPSADEVFETRHALARHRWRYATQFTLKLVRATSIFVRPKKADGVGMLELQEANDIESQGLTYMLKSHQSKADIAFSAKVQAMLSGNRTPQVIRMLQRLLALRIKSFARFTPEQQREICSVVKYESRPQSTVIVKEGHDPWGFYFILSGQCEVYRTKKEKKYRVNILNVGDFFGEHRIEGKRTVSVACLMASELLQLNREDYELILHMNDSENIASRVSALTQIPHFQSTHPSIIERIAQTSQLHTFQPQETIVAEGAENFHIFFVIAGSARAVKLVPFLRRQTTPECATHSRKHTLVAYEPGVTEVGPEDRVVVNLLTVRELGPGDHFPDISATVNPDRFNRIELMSRLSSDGPNRLDARAYISVIATTKLEVIMMTRVDYARVATNDMIVQVLASRALLHVPVSDLQVAYLHKRLWDIFKRKCVEQVVKDRKLR